MISMLMGRGKKYIDLYQKSGIYKMRKYSEILNLRNTVTEIKHVRNGFKSRVVNRKEDW